MSYEYGNSGYSDSAYSAYASYLQQRIDALRSSGSLANASKALSLTGTLRSAMTKNVSASISNITDQIMRGNATPQDKYNLITQQYMRAESTGDVTLMDSLASRADSLSQTIQLQQQTAQANQVAYARAQGSADNNVASQFENGLRQMNADVGAGGMPKFNDASKQWVESNKTALLAMANSPSATAETKAAIEKAVNTSQPSYQDIVAGVTAAIITAHMTAANSLAGSSDPQAQQEAQTYYNDAVKVANGQTKIPTLAGDLSAADVMTWQQQPGMFIPHENTTGGKLSFSYKSAALPSGASAVAGYQYDAKGNLVPVFTGNESGANLTQDQVDKINTQLTNLGVSFKKLSVNDNITNGIAVTFNKVDENGKAVPSWLKDATFGQKDLTTQMYITPQGLQFGTLDQSGAAHSFLIAADSNGLSGLYKGENQNGQVVFRQQNAQGEYGFNQNQNSVISSQPQSALSSVIQQVKGNTFQQAPQANTFQPTAPTSAPSPLPSNPAQLKPTMMQRQGGGYNFTYGNQAISAARYSQLTNTPFRSVLQTMATSGDTGAQTALGFVGNDFGYDPTKAASYQNSGTYNALTWGVQGVNAAPSNAPASVLGNGASLTY
jgi:hypothetical protein